MRQEFEIIENQKFQYLNVFLVRIISRSPHMHREFEIGTVLDGEIEIKSQDEKFKLTKDEFYLMNPLVPHEFYANEKGALMLIVQFSPRFLKMLLTDTPRIKFDVKGKLDDAFSGKEEEFSKFKILFRELCFRYFCNDEKSKFLCTSLMPQLFYNLISNLEHETISEFDYNNMRQKADRIISVTDYVDQHFTSKLLLCDIAERENLSLTYLSHLFTDTIGLSFQEYLGKKRFEYAYYLITTTDRNILDISLCCGFSNVRYLNKMFCDRFGCTPKQYRKGFKNNNENKNLSNKNTQYFVSQEDSLSYLTAYRVKFPHSFEVNLD